MTILVHKDVPRQPILVMQDMPIRQDDEGRYCLNDLHRASGSEQKHRPKYWLSNKQTIELIEEISIGGITPIYTKQGLGTFVCKDLVYSYAMWISAKFFLHVIRAYDSIVSISKPSQPKTTKQDRTPLKNAVNRLIGASRALNYSQAYKLIHAAFDVDDIDQIPKEKLPVVVTYVNGLIGEYLPYEKPKQIELPKGSVVFTAGQMSHLTAIATHMLHVSDWWRKNGYDAVNAINKNMAASITEHFSDGAMSAGVVASRFGIDLKPIKNFDWSLSEGQRYSLR